MSSGTPSEETSVAGIHVQQARDVTLRAGGDIVAGDKTTIHNYYGPKPQDITKAPYKFLSYYDIGDRDIFFGRDAVVEELAGEIPRHKVLIINGQSGSGKTSLINAGLIPRLAENGYLYVYFRDYTNPLEQLREYFRDHPDFALPEADKLSLLQILRTIRSQQESPVVVIFDQFERFLINVAAEPRREFLQQLRECLESDLTADELNLAISLRDDFFGKLLLEAEAIIPTFGTDSHHHNLRTLTRDEARQAIIQPLKNIPNIGFDGKFVDDVLLPHLMGASGTDGESVLPETKIEPPHLQIVCNQLYEAADRQLKEDGEPIRIGFDLYHDLGETEGMLRDYLDDVVRRITNGDPKQIAIVRSTLKLMIETVGTRRFESLDDIAAKLPDVPRNEAERIVQTLQESRVVEAKQSGHETEFSLSHEFMVAKVQSWYDEREMERRRAEETLDRGLAAWHNTRSVLDEEQLALINRWIPTNSLQSIACELLTASRQRRIRQVWGKRIALVAMITATLLMPVAVVFWRISVRKTKEAQQSERKAIHQLVTTKLELADMARERADLAACVYWYWDALDVMEHSDPRRGAVSGLLSSWSRRNGRPILCDHPVKRVFIGAERRLFASTSSDNLDLQIYNVRTSEIVATTAKHESRITSVVFAPDGQEFVTFTDQKYVRVWQTTTCEKMSQWKADDDAGSATIFWDGPASSAFSPYPRGILG